MAGTRLTLMGTPGTGLNTSEEEENSASVTKVRPIRGAFSPAVTDIFDSQLAVFIAFTLSLITGADLNG